MKTKYKITKANPETSPDGYHYRIDFPAKADADYPIGPILQTILPTYEYFASKGDGE